MSRPSGDDPLDGEGQHQAGSGTDAASFSQSPLVPNAGIGLTEFRGLSDQPAPYPFSRADLADFDAGRSRRPATFAPTIELICDAPRSAFAATFVHGLHHDFIAETGLNLDLKYVLRGCIIVALEVPANEQGQINLRHDFLRGRFNALIGKYRVFRVRFLHFPDPSPIETEHFGELARNELRFDLSEVRRSA